MERTLSIIKPDAVAKNVIGAIYDRFEKSGLKIVTADNLADAATAVVKEVKHAHSS